MIDMIGFGIVIPFLTYLVEDLAADKTSLRRNLGRLVDDLLFCSSIPFLSNLGWIKRQDWPTPSIDDRIDWKHGLLHHVWSANTLSWLCSTFPRRRIQRKHCCCSCLHRRCEYAETTRYEDGIDWSSIWPWIHHWAVLRRRTLGSC